MFTEGLDPHALRWVHEQRVEAMRGNRGAGLGIPPPEKFRSGFLPRGAVPVTRGVAIDDSGSDMDESSDTEEYVYGGRYSLDSSPRDEAPRAKAQAGGGAVGGGGNRYAQNQYSSDTYSEFSSSRETARQQVKQGGVNGYVEEEGEWSDSAGSTGYTQQAGRGNGGAGVRGSYVPGRDSREEKPSFKPTTTPPLFKACAALQSTNLGAAAHADVVKYAQSKDAMAQSKDEQLVVISQVLVADINIGYEEIVNTQVLAFNGKAVKNLKGLATMVENCDKEFLQFDLDYQQVVILQTATAKAATTDILTTHCIPSAMSDDLKT